MCGWQVKLCDPLVTYGPYLSALAVVFPIIRRYTKSPDYSYMTYTLCCRALPLRQTLYNGTRPLQQADLRYCYSVGSVSFHNEQTHASVHDRRKCRQARIFSALQVRYKIPLWNFRRRILNPIYFVVYRSV